MKLIALLLISLILENIWVPSLSEMIKNLRTLESYISQYKKEKNQDKLSLNYSYLY